MKALFRKIATLAYLLFLVSCGCNKGEPTSVSPPVSNAVGQREMEVLLEIIRQESLTENPYFETASIDRLKSQLDDLDVAQSPAEAYTKHLELAISYRRLGQDRLGVEHVTKAEEIADSYGLLKTDRVKSAFYFEAGLSWLRFAETTNCIHCRTGESCILPIQGNGIHKQTEGSTNAAKYFLKSLDLDPNNLDAIWLLNIAAMTLGKHPQMVPEKFLIPRSSFESTKDFPRFLDVSESIGLKTLSCGGALVTDDFDGDGIFDAYAASWAPNDYGRFFKSDGKGKYIDITEQAGTKSIAGGINAVQGDYDNDGLVDLFITRGAWLGLAGVVPNSLFKNLGNNRWQDVTYDVGIDAARPTPTAAWADIDNDGDLDLFVGNELKPCELYRNDGGKFVDISLEAGVQNGLYTKASSWGDFNNDRLPDLYVSNLDGPNRLYRNDGNGKFTDIAKEAGVTKPNTSFGSWFWDVNNDGHLDIYSASYLRRLDIVADDHLSKKIESEGDRLYLGDGKGGFRDVSKEYGLTTASEPMGCNFGDLDNDGYLDFYLGTGFPDFQGLMPNLMFHNVGGKKFENVTYAGGFGHLQKGHGTSFVDLDNDGDQDVYAQMGGAYQGDAFGDVVFENPGFGNHFLRVKLVGTKSNRSAIGAKIRADINDAGLQRSVFMWVNSGGSFGGRPLAQQLGLGKADQVDRLEVYWPTSNTTQVFENVKVNTGIEITEGKDKIVYKPLLPVPFAKPAVSATNVSQQ